MKSISRTPVLGNLLVLIVLVTLAQADEAEMEAIAAAAVVPGNVLAKVLEGEAKFQSWPGKYQMMKPGFKFNPGDFRQLSDLKADKDELYFREHDVVLRSMQFRPVGDLVSVVIGVSSTSCEEAQRAFLHSGAFQASIGFHQAFQRGSRESAIGDVAWIRKGERHFIGFVRNNIFCTISAKPDIDFDMLAFRMKVQKPTNKFDREFIREQVRSAEASGEARGVAFDVWSFAKEIDSAIKKMPDVSADDVNKNLPTITKFELSSVNKFEIGDKIKLINGMTEFFVSLSAKDPRAESVSIMVQGPAEVIYPESGGTIKLRTDKLSSGEESFTAVAMNESLLSSSKSLIVAFTAADAEAGTVLTDDEINDIVGDAIQRRVPSEEIDELINRANRDKLAKMKEK